MGWSEAAEGGVYGGSMGAAAGPWGAAIGAGLGAALYGTGVLGKKEKPIQEIDISSEMAKIASLFDEQRKVLKTNVAQALGEMNASAASSMAGRGTYSSPVSEYTYGANRGRAVSALSTGLAEIGGQEANMRTNLLNALLGYKVKRNDTLEARKMARESALIGLLGGGAAKGLRALGSSNSASPSRPPTATVSDPQLQQNSDMSSIYG